MRRVKGEELSVSESEHEQENRERNMRVRRTSEREQEGRGKQMSVSERKENNWVWVREIKIEFHQEIEREWVRQKRRIVKWEQETEPLNVSERMRRTIVCEW